MRKVKEIIRKINSDKKISILTYGLLITLILTWGGVTYSLFNYTNDNANNNDINSGHISMTYTEPSNEYVVENALPIKDAEGMNTNNYFEFSVTTTAPTSDTDDEGVSIPYEITITETEGNTLTNDKIKMYVTEVEGDTEITHTNPTLVSYFESSLYKDEGIKVGFNLHLHRNGNETITTKYRLRAWLDYDVDVSDWDTANKYQYKFKVNVNGEATYQGYETNPSCFAYEENDRGNYSIIGYDFSKCGSKNIVIPTYSNDTKTVMYREILSVNLADENEYKEWYKNISITEYGLCNDYGVINNDEDWQNCLMYNGYTLEEFDAEASEMYYYFYKDFSFMLETVGENFNDYEEYLMGYDDYEYWIRDGILDFNIADEEEIVIKIRIDSIQSFVNNPATQVSNSKYNMRTNNLDNIVPFDKQQLLAVTDTKPVVNVIVVPENIEIAKDAFYQLKLINC